MSFAECILVLIISGLLTSSVILAKPARGITDHKVEALKQKILTKLGYKEPPVIRNISSNIHQQRMMIRKYKEHMRDQLYTEEDRYPETLRVYKPKESVNIPQTDDSLYDGALFSFDIDEKHPDDPQMETIISRAHLKLRINESYNRTARVKVHSDNVVFDMPDNEYVFSNIQMNTDVVYLDVTSLLKSWLENPKNKFGISVSLASNISQILNVVSKSFNSDKLHLHFEKDTEPLLEVFSYEKRIIGRQKRQSGSTGRRDCVKGDGENRCCRFQTYISFKDLQWDNWILHPEGYTGYYCDGECPHRFKMANTFTGIKSLLHMKNPSTFNSPCCVPSKLSKFMILHRDETGTAAFMDLDDLIVEDCKCA